jgi:hypothetical protein
MNRIRATLLMALIGTGSVLLPAEKSEAGLIDWLRCVFHPCRSCEPCAPTCDIPSCPPVVQEGSYCNPCSPCAPAAPCPVSYVRRSYMEARTLMTSQTILEPRPTYVRRHYWDPCSRCYKTYFETATSYVKRRYCVPVTDYVERSYLEPVSCVTPSCPSDSCPVSVPGTPVEPMPLSSPAATLDRTGQPIIGGADRTRLSPAPSVRYPTPANVPGRRGLPYAPAGA